MEKDTKEVLIFIVVMIYNIIIIGITIYSFIIIGSAWCFLLLLLINHVKFKED
jgi:hypothetical protein